MTHLATINVQSSVKSHVMTAMVSPGKITKVSFKEVILISTLAFSCRHGFEKLGSTCIHAEKTHRTFKEARDYCLSLGARIYEPRDMATEKSVHEYLTTNVPWGGSHYNGGDKPLYGPWLGMKNLNGDGV